MSNNESKYEQYRSDMIQRNFKVMFIMAGHEVHGISPSELAKLAQTSPSDITRITANLKLAGIAELLPSNSERWRLAPKLAQVSNTILIGISNADQQLQQDQHNYSRLSH